MKAGLFHTLALPCKGHRLLGSQVSFICHSYVGDNVCSRHQRETLPALDPYQSNMATCCIPFHAQIQLITDLG